MVKSARTNTPLHALVTLNDTTFVESARALAQRVLKNAALNDDLARFDFVYRVIMARQPTVKEQQTLLLMLETLRAKFSTTPDDALKLITVGEAKRDAKLNPAEHAAWSSLCLMILNLDETLSKE